MSEEKNLHYEAQLGVIGSLLLDADQCSGEVFLRTREDQYTGEYRTIFCAAKKLHQEGKPIDPVTVKSLIGDDYTQMLLQIMELTPTAKNCGEYVDLLVEQAKTKQMQALGLALAGCRSSQEASALVEECNAKLTEKAGVQVVSALSGFVSFCHRQGEKAKYIPWGFRSLSDTVLSSLGDLVILGGRPSAGKTALSLQMAWEQAKKHKVGYFSLETNPNEIFDRLHAMAAEVDSVRARMHTLNQDEMDRIINISREFEDRKLDVIQAAGMTVADVRSLSVARGYEIVYVDYLQILSPGSGTKNGDRFGVVSQISMDLHQMAVSLGVLVVALSQLSRQDRASRTKAPDLFSLRESGQIEQDADAVMLLYKANEDAKESPRRLKIAKNKKGIAGGYLEMDFNGSTQRFSELRQRHPLRCFSAESVTTKNSAPSQTQTQLHEINGPDADLPF